jgi:hypothetical protein
MESQTIPTTQQLSGRALSGRTLAQTSAFIGKINIGVVKVLARFYAVESLAQTRKYDLANK